MLFQVAFQSSSGFPTDSLVDCLQVVEQVRVCVKKRALASVVI